MRWVYKKNPSEFSFIIDKNDRVVQIEGVGMSDSRVHTLKGVTFGSTFGEIIKKYGRPDAYEISGDNIVLRYLTRNKCAFRLNRLQPSKPHQVTAIVVAGGKMVRAPPSPLGCCDLRRRAFCHAGRKMWQNASS